MLSPAGRSLSQVNSPSSTRRSHMSGMMKPDVIASMKGGQRLTVSSSVPLSAASACCGMPRNQSGTPVAAGTGGGKSPASSRGQRNFSVRGASDSTIDTMLVREHPCLTSVQQHTVLERPAHGARQHAALDVAALADQRRRGVAMADALDVLFDDRPLVQIGGHEVGGGADQLHAAGVRLVIGPGALEPGQERVVDIDAAAGKPA